ncbi:RDD family protein [Candidatus Woesearchaeota archaeon]|nr:RDD family protein [Candidatus Woesearchaeota archaeon]
MIIIGGSRITSDKDYIGFGIRFIAAAIDSIIFFIAFWIIGRFFIYLPFSLIKITLISIAVNIIAEAIYEIFITSKYGGTVGKLLMKCKVIDSKGNNISISDSVIRYFSKWLSTLALGIGYLMIIWDNKKQGLHDKIAETTVVKDAKSKIREGIKKTLIVIVLLIVVGYVLFYILSVALGITIALQTESKEVDIVNPTNSVLEICGSNINSKQTYNDCITRIAVSERNQSICDNAKSNYYVTICKKVYNFTNSAVDYLFKEKKLEFNGTLNVDDAVLGVLAGDKCIEVEDNDFTFDDDFCIIFNNIGPLEKGEDGLYWFDLGLWIYDDKGKLLTSFDKFLDKEGHIEPSDNLFNNNFLKKHTLELTLSKTIAKNGPGTYTYDIAVYDRISNKGKYVNKTLKVGENYNNKLTIMNDMLGVMAEGQGCVSKSNNAYTKKDSICVHAYNVSKFDKNQEGLHLFDMDSFIRNSSGGIIQESKNIYEESGLRVLRNNILNPIAEESLGVQHQLSALSSGNYTFELVVKDRIGKKQAKITKNFVIVDNKVSFIVDWYKIGAYDGFNCNSRTPRIFSPQETICFEPFATNLEEDSNGKIHFNMDETVYNSNGERMYYETNAFGDDGETLTSPLLGHFVYASLNDYPDGEYVYEVTIMDLISKEEVVTSERFTINENTSVFYSELDNFVNKYRDSIVDTITLGETKTYTINRVDYETLLLYIGPQGVRIMINGWLSDYLKSGETQKLPKGEMLLVNNLVKTETGDSVEFALGR